MLRLLGPIGVILVAFVLAACTGLTPVYGERAGAALAGASFNFAPPKNRIEQIIINRLAASFPVQPTSASPTLTVVASRQGTSGPLSDAVTVGQIVNVRVQATLTITRNDQQLYTVTRFTDAGYQGGQLVFTDMSSVTGAEENAALGTAESLRAALLATYRPPLN